MRKEHIIIRGAREHNLKNISLRIPKNRITVFTGVSGSGKSSLVEHDPDVIAIADHIVDIGPRAGTEGGKIIFEGTPDDLTDHPAPQTGKFLRQYLSRMIPGYCTFFGTT